MNQIVKPQVFFLSVNQVAERYGVSKDTIWRWCRNDEFPAPVKLSGGCSRWRIADIEQYDSQLTTNFAECYGDFRIAC